MGYSILLIFHGGRIQHPTEILAINDKVNVVVLDFDDDKKRICNETTLEVLMG